MISAIATIVLAASGALAAPAPALAPTPVEARQVQPFSQLSIAPWDAGATTQYPIHSSCNATQRLQIETGLNETLRLAQHARDHVLRWGNNSEIYRKYFGDRPSYEVIGGFDIIASGDKAGVLFRCDNPDGNCGQEGWAGHWRGSNATGETVICDLSYTTRRSLSSMCAQGYTVSQSPINTFWASDLMHRLYHMPAVGGGYIEHYADGHEEVVELALSNSTDATHDSESLQFFALEVYAFDVVVPGVGCPGTSTPSTPSSSESVTVSTTASATATATAAAVTSTATATGTGTPTTPETASSTSELPDNCHTHEGGFVHCTK